MTDQSSRKSEDKPRDRIFQASVKLFAEKGFNAVSVRELADTARVNPAMINYYFGSKVAILKEIIDTFFTPYMKIIEGTFAGGGTIEERLCLLVRRLVEYFRANREMVIIAFTELPFDHPEIAEYKARYVNTIRGLATREMMGALNMLPGRRLPLEIFGPALIGMLLSHFLLRPIIERLDGVVLDDVFYESYPDIISDIYLHGVVHSAEQYLQRTNDKGAPHA